MKEMIIRNYVPEDIGQVIQVQEEYRKKYPDYIIRGESVYTHHPLFENGKNILCALDQKGKLLAYGPMVPAPALEEALTELEHHIWADIIYDPSIKEWRSVMDLLCERILHRATEIKSELPQGRATRLAIQKFSGESEGIHYFTGKGFEHYQSAYLMARDLTKNIPDVPTVKNVHIRRWQIETQEDKLNYIKADHLCFPSNPMTLEKLEWNLEKLWRVGSAIGAFDEKGELIGNVMAFWSKEGTGITEEVFVLPQWRGKGIAPCLLREALTYLKECGRLEAELEVTASNENALSLYKGMGYAVRKEECFLGIYI